MYNTQRMLAPSLKIEEISFSVAVTQDLAVIDTVDWLGSLAEDFSDNRVAGAPILDWAVRMTAGTANINLLALLPTFPINNATPVYASEDIVFTAGVGLLAWSEQTRRLPSRFYRIQIERTGAVNPCTGYLVAFLRGQ